MYCSNKFSHELLTTVRAYSEGNIDRDTFGLLSSSSSNDRHNASFVRKTQRKARTFPESQQLDTVNRWNKFKEAESEKIVSRRIKHLDSDSEVERTNNLKGKVKAITRINNINDIGKRTGNIVKILQTTDTSLSNTDKYSKESNVLDPDKFGTVSPLRFSHENEVGDEGDEREQKYQDSLDRRKHTPTYYGLQMKKLCKERKVSS